MAGLAAGSTRLRMTQSGPRQAANVSQAAPVKEVNSLKLSRGSVHKDNDRRRSSDRGGRALDVALAGLIAERLATEPHTRLR
jgi:hypothetical protein